jgi:hypothetical protein
MNKKVESIFVGCVFALAISLAIALILSLHTCSSTNQFEGPLVKCECRWKKNWAGRGLCCRCPDSPEIEKSTCSPYGEK